MFEGTHHSDGLRTEHLRHTEGGVEGDVGHHVDKGDHDAGDGDGPRQVPHRVLHLLDDKVEVVPTVVGEETWNLG